MGATSYWKGTMVGLSFESQGTAQGIFLFFDSREHVGAHAESDRTVSYQLCVASVIKYVRTL